jgi:pimeloyl-ACP methyl ester carboxylesterase
MRFLPIGQPTKAVPIASKRPRKQLWQILGPRQRAAILPRPAVEDSFPRHRLLEPSTADLSGIESPGGQPEAGPPIRRGFQNGHVPLRSIGRELSLAVVYACVAAALSFGGGCRSVAVVADWRSEPGHCGRTATEPSNLSTECRPATTRPAFCRWPTDGTAGQRAQQFFALAEESQNQDDSCSPDYYYQAALCAWQCLFGGAPDVLSPEAASSIYHASVAGLIVEAERCGRFDPRGLIVIYQPDAALTVPFACLGLPWQPGEIGTVKVASPPAKPKLSVYHACAGFGLPVIAVRRAGSSARLEEPYLPPQLPFAATVVLRPADSNGAAGAVLEFYDPLTVETVAVRGQAITMARDLSAPVDYRLRTTDRGNILGFLDPGQAERGDGLRFLQPYQRGKIPVVFVHGLLSDPTTWLDVANDLRSHAWFNDNYQIWAFSYATGRPFIGAAAILRSQFQEALATLDPAGQDAALRQTVIVGHSMGGLVAKLQITYSDDAIWNSFANTPLDSINAPAQGKFQMAERCYFDPQPAVRRVVFIATPHDGSSFAARGIGRLSSALVEPAPEDTARHAGLVTANPEVFSEKFERRVPTGIDILEPDDPTLQAIRTLRVSSCVKLHSIIGTGHPSLSGIPGDGVVPIDSARHPCVESELYVGAVHTSILRNAEAQAEIRRILWEHLQSVGCTCK